MFTRYRRLETGFQFFLLSVSVFPVKQEKRFR
jgi:hypothetical protein